MKKRGKRKISGTGDSGVAQSGNGREERTGAERWGQLRGEAGGTAAGLLGWQEAERATEARSEVHLVIHHFSAGPTHNQRTFLETKHPTPPPPQVRSAHPPTRPNQNLD